jgi:hypothetical protein
MIKVHGVFCEYTIFPPPLKVWLVSLALPPEPGRQIVFIDLIRFIPGYCRLSPATHPCSRSGSANGTPAGYS